MSAAAVKLVDACAALADLSANERHAIDKLTRRIARGLDGTPDDVDMSADEARYLALIAEAHGVPTESQAKAGDDAAAAPIRAASDDPASRPTGEADAPDGDGGASLPAVADTIELRFYDAARTALAQAAKVDEVLEIKNQGAAMQTYARLAENWQLFADAFDIQQRAERRLGVEIPRAKSAGDIRIQGQRKSSDSEPLPPTLDELGISKKLSARAQALAALDEKTFEASIVEIRAEILDGKRLPARDVLKRAGQAGEFAGARATMAGRREPADSLDYFPTPPWATRALITDVFGHALGIKSTALMRQVAYEPACGEGHITGVLQEYFGEVAGSDIFDYSHDSRWPPGWRGLCDYLDDNAAPPVEAPDWIITNPPFEEKALKFALRALKGAKRGVALFTQLRWLETIERYEKLFKPMPPSVVAIFVERVACKQSYWDPDGGSATAYCWLVWLKPAAPKPLFWIPPGQRDKLSHSTDVDRFTAHPVKPFVHAVKGGNKKGKP